MQKIEFGVHPDAEAAGFDKMTTIIEVELDDGSVVKGSADFGKGSPANPMSWSEVCAKFEETSGHGGLSAERARQVISMVEDLPDLPDIRTLTAALAG